MLPVWVAETEADAWEFVAAADRNQARRIGAYDWYTYTEVRVRRLWADGRWGGRPRKGVPQAMVDTDAPGLLGTRLLASIGWYMCERCEDVWTNNPSRLCDSCEDEAQDEADDAMDLAHGEAVAR